MRTLFIEVFVLFPLPCGGGKGVGCHVEVKPKHLCGFLCFEILHSLTRVQNDKNRGFFLSLRASTTCERGNQRVENLERAFKTFDCFADARNDIGGAVLTAHNKNRTLRVRLKSHLRCFEILQSQMRLQFVAMMFSKTAQPLQVQRQHF